MGFGALPSNSLNLGKFLIANPKPLPLIFPTLRERKKLSNNRP